MPGRHWSTTRICHVRREISVGVRAMVHGALQNWYKLGEKMPGLGDSCWWEGTWAWAEADRVRVQPCHLPALWTVGETTLPCFLSCESEIVVVSRANELMPENGLGTMPEGYGRSVNIKHKDTQTEVNAKMFTAMSPHKGLRATWEVASKLMTDFMRGAKGNFGKKADPAVTFSPNHWAGLCTKSFAS